MVGRHRKDGWKEGIEEMNSQEESRGDSPDKQSILTLLAEPGCLLCREEHKAEDSFFTWYATQRVRLEVLAWELGESNQKDNWSIRYENKGWEQSAWKRAVAQYSGTLAIS